MNHLLFNRAKSAAYAKAVTQLQCVIEKGDAAQARTAGAQDRPEIADLEDELKRVVRPRLPLSADSASKGSTKDPATECELAEPLWIAHSIRKALLQKRLVAVREGWKTLAENSAREILRARRIIDIQAYAGAQAGVPDSAAMVAAVEAVAKAMPPLPTAQPPDTTVTPVPVVLNGHAGDSLAASSTESCASVSFAEVLSAQEKALDAIAAARDGLKSPSVGSATCIEPMEDASSSAEDSDKS